MSGGGSLLGHIFSADARRCRLEAVAQAACEHQFIDDMAQHTGESPDAVRAVFHSVSPCLAGLVQSPDGRAVLSAIMMLPGSIPLSTTLH